MPNQRIRQLVRDELEGLKAYRVPPRPPAVKLDANESAWPLPGEAWERILGSIRALDLNRYPDGAGVRLHEALARRLGGDPGQFVVGAGSDELIALLATALSKPRSGRHRPVVVVPEPTFVMYAITSRAHGWRTVGVPLDEQWDLDLQAMAATLEQERPNIVYYASPNNPTGNCFSRDRIEELVHGFPDTLHVIDEAYIEFAENSASAWTLDIPHCALLGTLSKIGFAAIRVGWARLEPGLAHELEKVRQPFNLNAMSQTIATLALSELAPTIQAQVSATVAERERLSQALGRFDGLSVFPSEANFLLVRCEDDVEALCARLLEREIAVRRFAKAKGRLAECFRVTVGTPGENERLLQALEEVV